MHGLSPAEQQKLLDYFGAIILIKSKSTAHTRTDTATTTKRLQKKLFQCLQNGTYSFLTFKSLLTKLIDLKHFSFVRVYLLDTRFLSTPY